MDTAAVEVPKQANPSLPLRLKIPRIKVDAAIEYVGLTPQGDMDEPSGPASVAWYKQGLVRAKSGTLLSLGTLAGRG